MLRVRLAEVNEATLVHHVMQRAFAEYAGVLMPPTGALAESPDDVSKAMVDGGAVLAWDDDEVVGSARFKLYPAYLYVGRVSVIPAYRGNGVGRAMMDFVEDFARERGLDRVEVGVRMSLPGNVAFYQRLDYAIVKAEPHPKGGDTVVWMAKRLSRT